MTITGGWRVGDAGTTIFGPKRDDGSAPEIIAQKVRREHARLIAAAPDLLAACVDAERELTCVVHLMGRKGGLYEEALNQCRAAIAKAKGTP